MLALTLLFIFSQRLQAELDEKEAVLEETSKKANNIEDTYGNLQRDYNRWADLRPKCVLDEATDRYVCEELVEMRRQVSELERTLRDEKAKLNKHAKKAVAAMKAKVEEGRGSPTNGGMSRVRANECSSG